MRLEVVVVPVSDVERAKGFYEAPGWRLDADFPGDGGFRVMFHDAGTAARSPGPAPERKSYGSFPSFNDPDGNGWFLQGVTTRLPGR